MIVLIAGVLFSKYSEEQGKGLGTQVLYGNACCQLCWAPAMGFIFLSPHLHWGASPTGLVVANLNCLWMSIGQCCLPPLTGAAAVGGMKFGFSFSWSGERKDCHLWDSAGNATVFFFLPTLCEESQYSRFYLMKRLFTTWLCLLQLCTFKSLFWFWFVVFFFFSKSQENLPCFILFVIQNKCFNLQLGMQ